MDFAHARRFGPKANYPKVLAYKAAGGSLATNGFTVIAGPCSIESFEQVEACAVAVADIDRATDCQVLMRGGVFKAGTYPPEGFGLDMARLKMWSGVCRAQGLGNVVEVLDVRDIERVDDYATAFQVGARQGQGYALLNELSKTHKQVFLKNGAGMKLDEILGAAEYLARGRCEPRIIIRGSASFHDHVRWDMSVSLIPAIKKLTGIPVIGDPSHGTGRRDLVADMGMACIGAGADGILVEMHPNPDKSVSDSEQALSLEEGQALCLRAAGERGMVRIAK